MKFDGQTFTITHTAGPGITLENTNSDEDGGLFKFNKDGSSPATNDAIGTISWASEDSGGNGTTYAKLMGTIADVNADSEQGAMKFFVAELDGTLTEGMRIEGANSDGDVTVDIATHDGANGGLKLGGTLVTSTAAELNLLDGGVGLNDLSDTAVSGTISSDDGLLMVFDNAGSGLYIGDNTHNNLQRGDDDFSAGNTDSYNNRVALGGNTHIGWCAGSGSKTGYHNTLVGTRAGHKLGTLQYGNTFVGFNAGSGLKNGGFTSLASNIIVGYNAATAPSFIGNWYSNVIIGNDTITKGGQSVNQNVAIGENVLQNVNTSYKIVSIGYDAFYNADTINDSVVIGYQAGYNATIVDEEVLIGHQAGYGVASGDSNVMIGYQTAYYQDRNDTVAIGTSAGGGKSGAGYVDGGVYLGHMAGYSTSIARDHNELYIANNQISAEGTLIKGDFGHKLVAIGAADEDLTSASGTLQLYVKHPTTKGLYVKGAFGQTAPLAEFYNHNSEKAVEINSFGVLHASGISAGPSGLRINGTAVTASATELNALDGFTGSSIGSGTMSKLHVGVNGSSESVTDGSGLMFVAGDNMTISLEGNNGSGILTFASSASGGGGGTATSGNAFSSVSIAGDTGYTWAGQTAASGSVTAGGDADTLTLVAGTGIHMRADSNNNALLIAASGFPPTSSATGFGDVVLYDTSKEMYKSWTGLRAVGANNNLLAGHPTTVQLGIDTGRGVNIFGDVSNSLTNSPSILVHSQASSPTSLGGFIDLSQGRGQIDTSMEGPSSASGDACGTVIYSCTDSANATAAFVSAVQGRVINPEAGKVSGKIEFHTARGKGDTQPTDRTRAMVLNELGNLDVSGVVRANGISAQASGLRIGGVAVTSDAAELNILDGVTATSTELNIMDAGATVTTPTVAGGDAFVMNDADVGMRQVDIDNVDTYLAATTKTLTNKTLTSPTITSPTITGEVAIGRLVNPGKEKLQVAGEIATSGIRISGRRTVSGVSAPGTPSGVFTVQNHQGLDVLQINSVGVLYASGVSAGPSGLRIDGVAVTSSATELNYVDGVTSAIQTQLDTKGSGTMSKFHVGVNGSSDAVTDGSGLMFVAGDNMTVSLEGNNGSGILTFAASAGGASDIDGLSDCLVENNSIFLGNDPSSTTSSASYNIGLGTTALEDITTGDGNVAIGYNASKDLTTGTYTVAIGYEANVGATTLQYNNVIIGKQAGESTASFTNRLSNVIIGPTAGKVSHVQDSVIIGTSAGQYIGDAGGAEAYVVAIGSSAMCGNSSDVADNYGSVGIGRRAGGNKGRGTAADFCIYLGFEAGYGDFDHASNMLYIANDEPAASGAGGTIIKANMEEKHVAIGDGDMLEDSAGSPTLQVYPKDHADAAIYSRATNAYHGNLLQFEKNDRTEILVVASGGHITTSEGITTSGASHLASGVNIGFERSSLESSDGYALEVAGQIKSSGIVTAPITASDAATVTFDLRQSNFHMLTLERASTTLVFDHAEPGQRFLTRLTQDGTGGRNVVFPGGISWARAAGQGTPPPPSATAGHSTMYGFICTSGVAAARYYDGFLVGSGIQGTST